MSAGGADLEHLHDVGVLQPGHRLRLDTESRQRLWSGVPAGQDHLESDGAFQGQMPRLIDDAHAAAAKHPLDLVAWHRHRCGRTLRLHGLARHVRTRVPRGGRRTGRVIGGHVRARWRRGRLGIGGAEGIVGVSWRHRSPCFGQLRKETVVVRQLPPYKMSLTVWPNH